MSSGEDIDEVAVFLKAKALRMSSVLSILGCSIASAINTIALETIFQLNWKCAHSSQVSVATTVIVFATDWQHFSHHALSTALDSTLSLLASMSMHPIHPIRCKVVYQMYD